MENKNKPLHERLEELNKDNNRIIKKLDQILSILTTPLQTKNDIKNPEDLKEEIIKMVNDSFEKAKEVDTIKEAEIIN